MVNVESGLYNKTIQCPVCAKKFEVTKVKQSACKVSSRDTDFCIYYEGINPIFYDVWVCEFCGYAATAEKFETINSRDIQVVKDNISVKWKQRSFSGSRDVESAIQAFKLVLFNLQLRKAKSNEIARICIRIAWLYRIKKDAREMEFLQYALQFYNDTFEKEKLPIDKFDEFTCMYIIGELNRRIGNFEESMKWFSKIIGSPEARKNVNLFENARDQYQLAKEQAAKAAVNA